jgi:hypothetical protein
MDMTPSQLTDIALATALSRLAVSARHVTADLVAHLAEFDARRLYLPAGFASMFTYCCAVLHLSESEAYNRIEAARAMRRFPRLLDRLRDGSLNLTTVRLLAPHLTEDNQGRLLALASGKSRRQLDELLAAEYPQPPVPALVRKLPTAPPRTTQAHNLTVVTPPPSSEESPRSVPTPQRVAPRANLIPLSSDDFLVKFTARAATRNKLREAQDLLRHTIPNGDVAQVIDRALDALLVNLRQQKFAATDRPRSSKAPARGSRHVAARVRRAVWARDGGRCAFVGRRGRRCEERAFLEFHHLDPHVLDSTGSVDGIELRCRAHNAYEATLYFGAWPGRTAAG